MAEKEWRTHNPEGKRRVVVTKELPGDRWLEILTLAGCRVDICTSPDIVSIEEIQTVLAGGCDGAIGQLTEHWGEDLFSSLNNAGGTAYSNYAVGYNNVDVKAATRHGLPVGNTPGVLTDTTAELAVALAMACARRTVEADRFMRQGLYHGWLPTLFLGELLKGKTVGVIGAGRIGGAFGRAMVEGFKMNLIYYDVYQNTGLENYISAYGAFLASRGEAPVSCRRAGAPEDVLREADLVSLHTVLDESTRRLINAERLALMKDNAILINTSRGPVIDEAALVDHCRRHPNFRAGLDVFENEPDMAPGLVELDNVVIPPHIGSATMWTRSGMAILAAANVAGILQGFPVWHSDDISPFLGDSPPRAAPSIINARDLGLMAYEG